MLRRWFLLLVLPLAAAVPVTVIHPLPATAAAPAAPPLSLPSSPVHPPIVTSPPFPPPDPPFLGLRAPFAHRWSSAFTVAAAVEISRSPRSMQARPRKSGQMVRRCSPEPEHLPYLFLPQLVRG